MRAHEVSRITVGIYLLPSASPRGAYEPRARSLFPLLFLFFAPCAFGFSQVKRKKLRQIARSRIAWKTCRTGPGGLGIRATSLKGELTRWIRLSIKDEGSPRGNYRSCGTSEQEAVLGFPPILPESSSTNSGHVKASLRRARARRYDRLCH